MRRSSMIVGGAVVGVAAVVVMPRPSKPQQVAIAGNAGAAKTSSHASASTAGQTSTASSTTAASAPKHPTKTVTGALAIDQYGQLRVRLTVKNGRIIHVGFTTFVANDGHSIQIDQQAAPILIRETIAAQSAHIQGVSGATYTSTAYEQSLQAAIDKVP